MKVGIIGCGYVFDTYMRTAYKHPEIEVVGITDKDPERAEKLGQIYGFKVYDTNEALLANDQIELIINLTSVASHFEVSKAAILAGKHVYSEKPFAPAIDEGRMLADLAGKMGVQVSAAPCNLLSDSIQTAWHAVIGGGIGTPKLVYAEFDDNPIYLMRPETWRSKSGAPWPYKSEYEEGCTYEHAGYHLAWLAAMFGPAKSVTAFSSCLIEDKRVPDVLDPNDTPDFSVGCIVFQSGVVARVTCSIVAPSDHRIRIIGDEGVISLDTYKQFQCPVFLERFSSLSLNARKSMSVRRSPLLQRVFGIGGYRLRLIDSGVGKGRKAAADLSIRGLVNAVKRRELDTQDKFLGVAHMIRAINANERLPIPIDFVLHINELTLAIQGAGAQGGVHNLETSFEPLQPLRAPQPADETYKARGGGVFGRLSEVLIERLHKH